MKKLFVILVALTSIFAVGLLIAPEIAAQESVCDGLTPSDNITFYPEGSEVIVDSCEEWMNHLFYDTPEFNDSYSPLNFTAEKDLFICEGGPCNQDWTYKYQSDLYIGYHPAGSTVSIGKPGGILHNNPDDERNIIITANGEEIKVCEDGWVTPPCEVTLEEQSDVIVQFNDSIALRQKPIVKYLACNSGNLHSLQT